MPPRNIKSSKQKASAADVDIDSFFASQQSTGSDDANMVAIIAQQMQASMEKKNKARDVKFVQAAKNELKKLMAARCLELKDFVDAL
ncbi:hypothetical protein BV25DRAFT_1919764 [Artomyces pyxidatus]|uniref:Uncharacterized protein n=1 Tax=Artomyces pyxidatus TaxID=48021 RepID=A0ACB8SPR6_9AGAM|nr:hypothetical protein BV25DRAFT_1919764 [Artomyces pyxidatus]